MKRRTFMRLLGAMSFGLLTKSSFASFEPITCPLKITKCRAREGSLLSDYYELTKGPNDVSLHFCDAQTLVDCHGLCVVDELFYVLTFQLEYGKTALPSLPLPESPWKLSVDERTQVRDLVKTVVGKHDCVHSRHGLLI